MKSILLISFLLLGATSGHTQTITIDSVTAKYLVSEVIKVDSLSKDQLFSAARVWISRAYRSANDVTQLADKDAGKIICKGAFPSNLFMKQGVIRHTLILEFKDNRFRYTYTDFSYYSSGSGEMVFERNMIAKKKVISETEKDVKESINGFIKSLANKKGDDW